MTPLLRLDHVAKRFPGEPPVLDDVSLTVAAGEIVVLLGPSGCGKSTALRLAAGLEAADAGRIERPAADLGLVFQDATLMPWANALDNVALPLRLEKTPKPQARARAAAALAGVGLAGSEAKRPRELSGGMRMRVAVARALVGDPALLLMDEPFAALDEITRFRLGDDLLRLRDLRRLGVLFVTHSIFEAVSLADRILVMSVAPGRIVAEIAVTPDAARGAAFRAGPVFAETAAEVSRALAAASGGDFLDAPPVSG
ncbi:MAG: ATP-binding cassette domain-containing protein [Hyphomicrobiales bacterium]|nr:ATP-binding cassette domain-containing protein [Hyphomicrobiales bacterium]